jgi:hypothetical protein
MNTMRVPRKKIMSTTGAKWILWMGHVPFTVSPCLYSAAISLLMY